MTLPTDLDVSDPVDLQSVRTLTVPWYPELKASPGPELPGRALHFVFMAAILCRKLGVMAGVDFVRELRQFLGPMKESALDSLSEGAIRTAHILGLIVVSRRGLVSPGEALLSMRPWWEQ